MLLSIPALVSFQQVAAQKTTVSDELAAAQAVATFELAWWRKNHPQADLSLTFSDPSVTTAQINLVRLRVGYKNPIPVLDAHVLTLILDSAGRSAPKRLTMEGYVFLGSFPKGFRARYLIRTDGKLPQVMTRTVLQSYEMAPPPKVPKVSPTQT